jgi:hypothetical protein
MKNSQKILQTVKFIWAWTFLWVFLGFCASTLWFYSLAQTLNRVVMQQVGSAVFYAVPLSLVGSLISCGLVLCFDRPMTKRIVLSLFWGVFWILSVYLVVAVSAHSSGNRDIDTIWGWIILIATLFFIGLPATGIAYFASFAPILRPKQYRDWA